MIGDAIVDGGKAARAGVGEVGDLDGGGFSSEDAHAVAGGVEREIDEDVDLVFADERRELLVGKAGGVEPFVGLGAEKRGSMVGVDGVVVAGDFELIATVMLKGGHYEDA